MVSSISESTRLWEKALKKIQEKLNDKKAFDSWFENSYIYDVKGNVISVVVATYPLTVRAFCLSFLR